MVCRYTVDFVHYLPLPSLFSTQKQRDELRLIIISFLLSDIIKSYCSTRPLSVLVLFYVPASWRSVSSIKWNPQQYLGLRWRLRGVGSVVSKVRCSINNVMSGLNLEMSLSPKNARIVALCCSITQGLMWFFSLWPINKMTFFFIHVISILL